MEASFSPFDATDQLRRGCATCSESSACAVSWSDLLHCIASPRSRSTEGSQKPDGPQALESPLGTRGIPPNHKSQPSPSWAEHGYSDVPVNCTLVAHETLRLLYVYEIVRVK
jgi:hypothetical protein